MKIKLITLFLFFAFVSELKAQTIYARQNGDWDLLNTWSTVGTGGASCGCTPTAGDDVLIDGYDVDIDAGTGDVTVNSIKITNLRGTDVRLRVQSGATLTVTTDFEIENNSAGRDAELTVVGTGSGLDITGDFLADQDNGDDLLIDIDDNAQVNITGNVNFLQDGGDDLELNLNQNSGTQAQWNVSGSMILDHDGGDDMRILVDDGSSLLHIDGDLTVNMNAGLNDDMTLNIDNGSIDIAGDLNLNRFLTTSFIAIDMDGGTIDCDNLTGSSSGVSTLGDIRISIDNNSQLNCNDFNFTISGGDDLDIDINSNFGSTGQFNVANDFNATITGGDNIELNISEDDSEINVDGNVTIVCTGGDAMNLFIDNDGSWNIDGDMTVTTANLDGGEIDLAGGTDNPLLAVGGSFSWTNQTSSVDCLLDVNGGTFSTGIDFTLTNALGGDDMSLDLDEDAQITVLGDFLAEITGGDDIRIDIGDASVGSTARFDVTGNATFHLASEAGPGPIWRLKVYDDTRFTVGGELTFDTDFTSTALNLVDVQNTSEIEVDGNVVLNAPGSGELEVRLNDDSFFRIGGNFIRAAAPNHFGEFDASSGNGTVEYKGSTAQIIAQDDGGGGDSFQYSNLEIDNSFGTIPQLTLEGVVTVTGDLTMNDGVVASDVADILIVADDGTTSNASNDSYVDGYMRKVGNDAFTFPSGDGGFYGPISITAPSVTSEQFEALYFLTMPHDAGFDSTMHDPTIHHISKVEYWKLNRTSGASNPTVTLSWDTPRSGGVVNTADLRFMRWDGASWIDLGAASVTGSPVSGTLDNSVGISAFSDSNPYTIGTIDPINPLPIELVSFTAFLKNDKVYLDWITKSEINSAYFNVEKSLDGIHWTLLSTINAAGNSSEEIHYSDLDERPFIGLSYYRLKQVDFDGKHEYFGPVSVEKTTSILTYPNPANGYVSIIGIQDAKDIKLFTVTGQEISIQPITTENRIVFNTENIANGTYYLHYQGGVQRLVISH